MRVIQVLDKTQYIAYREHSFLSHPSVPRHVLWDKETVYMYWPGERQPVRYATGANLQTDSGAHRRQDDEGVACI